MKKFIALIVPIALFSSLTFGLSPAQAEDQVQSSTQVTDTQNEAIYKITPDDKEWANFTSKQEKVDATRIPADVLSKMTTDELVEAVLTYPLLYDIYAFNSKEAGLKSLSEQSDAFKELQNRNDAGDKLTERLQQRSLVESNALEPRTIDMLLSDKQISKQQTNEERSLTNTTYKQTNLKTPKGSIVVGYTPAQDMTTSEKTALKLQNLRAYPNAQFVSDATYYYNCHSYSFYSRLTSNRYGIPYPAPYLTDGSFVQFTNLNDVVIGTRFYFDNPNIDETHSGVVTGTINKAVTRENLTITSKWGAGPLMKHVAKDSPYYSGNIKFYKAN